MKERNAYNSFAFGLCTSQQNTTIQQWKQQLDPIYLTMLLWMRHPCALDGWSKGVQE